MAVAPIPGLGKGGGKQNQDTEPLHHPIHEQLPGLRYCINDDPVWPETIILGFQHYLALLFPVVFITSTLVPQMGGDNGDRARVIQTILFVSGINTLIQTFLGTRLPVVSGVSVAYLIPTLTIINSSRLSSIIDPKERFERTMREIQGALIAGSSLQVILGFSGLWGIATRFFSPVSIAPTVAMFALGLYGYGFAQVAKCVEIGIPAVVVILLFSQYLKHLRIKVRQHFHVFELFPVVLGLGVVWGYAHILTVSGAYKHASLLGQQHCRTDRNGLVSQAPWIKVPYPLQWGAPTFEAGHAFGIMAGVFAALVESTAGYYAVSRLAGATPPPPHVITRGIGWQGIGILLGGMFGTAAGATISPENIGLIGITRVGSRRVIQVAGLWMIFFGLFGKFGAIFASIPLPMLAAVLCIVLGIVAAAGISILQFTNINLTRNLFIVGTSLFLALSVPQYFNEFTLKAGHGPVHTGAHWFNDLFNVILSSHAVIALAVAGVLDNTIEAGISHRDRGMHWWSRFHKFTGDSRNEEFYRLPWNLHKFFPPT
ncbi:hypothetical protein Mapa_008230 [Marchantia paleacea]|nr:hypothetical protein Mapa_008230 [Marchantia paleacea]